MLDQRYGILDRIIRFCLENKLVVFLVMGFVICWGILVAPFDWDVPWVERDPVPVDAIPDIGENQQIVFTEWMGRSPQDVEDQISYPLTVALMGIPGVKTVRTYSMFGFSTIYIIFNEDIEFYWSRSRVLEKLNSLPSGTLPDGVQPALGPDATALGQVFWYTVEGSDKDGNPAGGWDPHELRTIQDWQVRYELLSAGGVSEVASVGGFVKEFQIDVDPDAMRAANVTLDQVFQAVRMSNVDVGARTIEVNKVEYIVRGLGFIENLADIEKTAVRVHDNIPIRIQDVGRVTLGPALRRGALDKGGSEAVGGVVVVRFGGNPLATIKNVKKKLDQIARRTSTDPDIWVMPAKHADGSEGYVRIVPFYDRTGLIQETLGTLHNALSEEILVTIIVVILMVLHLRSSILISGLLPLAVLMCFIAMKYFGVDANIVALSGIAIAIGTMVDMGIILCENILKHLEEAPPDESRLEVIFRASSEVGGAVLTAVATTVVSFLPVFTMEAAEGKLFRPLAWTKTFALISSVIVALTIIPPIAHLLFIRKSENPWLKRLWAAGLAGASAVLFVAGYALLGVVLAGVALYLFYQDRLSERTRRWMPWIANGLAVLVVTILLTGHWLPLGPDRAFLQNLLFVVLAIGGLLGLFQLFQAAYPSILRWCLNNKGKFLLLPGAVLFLGLLIWQGFDRIFFFVPDGLRRTAPVSWVAHQFPGLGKEFMPPLDEGSYLYMPTTMPHASMGECLDVLEKLDTAIQKVPEVDSVVGKIGRAETALDPAPISMVETIINYKPEYKVDRDGNRLRFQYDYDSERFARDAAGELIPDAYGRPFRNWRPHIRSADDIWQAISDAGDLPGTTKAPKLQPIAARIVMLQSGMRAPMGVKVKGDTLEAIEEAGLQIEKFLKQVPSVQKEAVLADRIIGKPYLEIDIDRDAIARYGIHIRNVQDVIEVAIGGKRLTMTVEGRERYPVRVRYARELRDQIETLGKILVPGAGGAQVPLTELAAIRYVRGPQVIKSEDTKLVGYVLFDMKPGHAEVDVVEDCQKYLNEMESSGEWKRPAGVTYAFAGSYENQIRSEKTLMLVLPLALFVIFLILYFQFKSVPTTLLVFTGIFVAWAGGFIMLWLYGQSWFMDVNLFGTNLRDLFNIHTVNLSVAVWVGFIALFGIATDDGVVIATYLDQSFAKNPTESVEGIRKATLEAGMRRVRPCLMTTATTLLALLPVLTSTGRGSDIMVPMAIPSFGGMFIEVLTMFVVPVLYCQVQEAKLKLGMSTNPPVSKAPENVSAN